MRDIYPLPLIHPRYKISLLTNPKCGGTSLKLWFLYTLYQSDSLTNYGKMYGSFGPYFTLRWFQKYSFREKPDVEGLFKSDVMGGREKDKLTRKVISTYQNLYVKRNLDIINTDDYCNAAIVRNPYSRVVSGYVDKFCSEPPLKLPFTQDVLSKVNEHKSLTVPVMNFYEFLDYLESTPAADLNPHWRPQSYLLDQFRIDQMVRIEKLLDDMQPVFDRVPFDSRFVLDQPRNPTSYKKFDNLDFLSMDNQQIIAFEKEHGCYPEKTAFLTDETRAQIRRIYKRDFEILPYDA